MQDFDYMRARCGHRYVKVKGDSCWDNKGRQLFLNDPTIEISVSDPDPAVNGYSLGYTSGGVVEVQKVRH